MSNFYRRSGPSELLPRYVFLEPILRDARVLELGVVDTCGVTGAFLLLARGAAEVVTTGSDPAALAAAAAEAPEGVKVRSGTRDLQDGSFDVVVLHDPARAFADLDEAARLRRPDGGFVLVPVESGVGVRLGELGEVQRAASLPYAEAVAQLTARFPSVEVATQQAVVGYALSPVSEEELDLTIETRLASPEAAYYLFLCGDMVAGLREQALVPLPVAPLLESWPAPVAEVPAGELAAERARVETLRRELDSAREAVHERETWISGLRTDVEQREAEALERGAELEALRARLVKIDRENEENGDGLRRVREQLALRQRELDATRQGVEARTEDLRLAEERLDRAQSELQQLRLARSSAEERVEALAIDLTSEKARAAALDAELQVMRAERDTVGAEARATMLQEAERRERDAHARLGSLAAELSAAQARAGRLEKDVATVASAERLARGAAEDAQGRLEVAHRRAEEAEARTGEALARAAVAEEGARVATAATLAAVVAERERVQAELDEARRGGAELAGAIEDARRDAAGARAATADVEGALSRALSERDRALHRWEEEVRGAEDLLGELVDATARMEELEAGLAQPQERIAGLERTTSSLQRDRVALENRIGILERERQELVAERDDARARADAAGTARDSLSGRLREAQREQDVATGDLRRELLGSELARADIELLLQGERQAREALDAQLADTELEREAALRRERELLDQLAELEVSLAAARRHISESRDVERLRIVAQERELMQDRADAGAGGVLEKLQAEQARLERALEDRDRRLELLAHELADKADRISRLVAEVNELRNNGLPRIFKR